MWGNSEICDYICRYNKTKKNVLHTTWVELTAAVDITRYEVLGSVVHQYSMVWPLRGCGGGITDDRVKTIISVVTIQPSQEYEWSPHGRYLVDIIYNRTDRTPSRPAGRVVIYTHDCITSSPVYICWYCTVSNRGMEISFQSTLEFNLKFKPFHWLI